ncbi:MAG: glycosyltransferase [Clostridiales bacterium]|nr:glycosyltransferase [Clostridiales bacterium]
MPESPFFSIVMPVYQVERYLRQAVASVLRQSFKDFELILIDDASPDDCPRLCEKLRAKDNRIRVYHLPVNGGVSNARNTGLDMARGKYLMFMDSDDTIESQLLERVYTSLKKNPARMVLWGMTEELYNGAGRRIGSSRAVLPDHFFDSSQELREYMIEVEKSTLYGYACNKVYDLAYLRQLGLRYQEYSLNEDILFNIAYCMDIDSLNILSDPAYHYRKVSDGSSRTGQFVPDYFSLHVKKIQALYDQFSAWGLCNRQVLSDLAAIYTRYIMSALQRNCDPQSGMTFRSRKAWLKRLYSQKLFLQIIPCGRSRNPLVRFLNTCLKNRRTLTCLSIGRLIYTVRSRLPALFNLFQKNR